MNRRNLGWCGLSYESSARDAETYCYQSNFDDTNDHESILGYETKQPSSDTKMPSAVQKQARFFQPYDIDIDFKGLRGRLPPRLLVP
jgi:hypothetical protein